MTKENNNGGKIQILYGQAQNVAEQLSHIKVFNMNAMEIYKSHEETMELYAQRVFGFKSDKEIFTRIDGVHKRMSVIHISKAISDVLEEIDPSDIQLIHLASYTDSVYEKIKKFKTIMKICGNPNDEAEFSLKENKRVEFIESLSMFVAKHILTYKLALNQIINPQIKGAIDRLVGIKDRTRTLHASMWQVANTLKEHGVSPKEAKQKILDVYTTDDEKLRTIARTSKWGYLQEKTDKKVIQIKNARLKNNNQHELV